MWCNTDGDLPVSRGLPLFTEEGVLANFVVGIGRNSFQSREAVPVKVRGVDKSKGEAPIATEAVACVITSEIGF